MYSSDTDFYSRYSSYFNVDNAIDYFIFMNFSRAEDNTGNNLFVAKYDKDEPYFYVPWDVDATFGNGWEGVKRNITDDILSNRFYDRLLQDYSDNGFRQRLKTKWEQLRNDWLTVQGLVNLFSENYDYLLQNGVYEREEITWKEKDNYRFDSQYMTYMQEWIAERLKFLDKEFDYTTAIPIVEESDIQYPCNVHVYNINGQFVKSIYLTNTEDKTLYFNLNKGIYILHFQNLNTKKVEKLNVY
jgi:hypothetical protein